MGLVLVFLASSSMHAEIAINPLPENANFTCRACQLSVDHNSHKNKEGYFKDFFCLTHNGHQLKGFIFLFFDVQQYFISFKKLSTDTTSKDMGGNQNLLT